MMKKRTLLTLVVAAILSSCGQSSTKEAAADSTLSPGCYEFTQNQTRISMQVEVNNETVTGQLVYDFYEKDDTQGTLVS